MMQAKLQYAGRVERLFANLLDTLFLMLPNIALVNLLGGEGPALLAGFAAYGVYYTYFVSSAWQATPGKRLLNIYVVMEDGSKPQLVHAFERFIVYVLPTLPLYTSVLPTHAAQTLFLWLNVMWFAPILYTPERRGVHDTLVGTRVVTGKAGLK